MDEQHFIQTINAKAKVLDINPMLLLSGVEALYTFRHVKIDAINLEFLDSLILTIFALRIGDTFHEIAAVNLDSPQEKVRAAALWEIREIGTDEIAESTNPFLPAFARIIDGKSPIRKYHEKALEVAAMEINKMQTRFEEQSTGLIMITLCKTELKELGLDQLFDQ